MLQLREDHKQIVKRILNKNLPQAQAIAFGSRTKGNVKLHSDLDLALKCDNPLNIDQLADLRDDFSFSDLPFFVDVVDYLKLEPYFKAIVDKEGIML
jgi:uncharacterized protein